MRRVFYRALWILAVCGSAFIAGLSQSAPGPAMFVGETLKYEGDLNKVLRGLSVADLTFSVSRSQKPGELVINAEAISKGTLLKLFRYSFDQQYASTVDAASLRILKSVKHDVQKERVRDSEALFDYKGKQVTFVETDPKDPMRPPRKIASEIGDKMYDMISAIYALRLLPLAVGNKLEFSVSDSGLVYKIPFAVTAREMQKTVLGNVWCLRIEPDVFGENRLIEQKGKMVIWVADDTRHTPVRSQITTRYGKFDIKLRSVSIIK